MNVRLYRINAIYVINETRVLVNNSKCTRGRRIDY